MIQKYSQLHKHRADFLEIIPKKKTPSIFKNTEILKNPDKRELLQIPGAEKFSDKSFAGFLLSSGDILVWDRYAALHQGVRDALKLPNTVISFSFYMNDNSLMVTDNIKYSIWDNMRSRVADQLEECEALQALGVTEKITYYDEDIVGDWKDLEDDND
ncbi:MAG: hypothetical protein WC511_02685 [Candidatus Pacearchaeota archaeon]